MRIGIDIDDTISDTCEVTFAYAQKYTIEELGKNSQIRDLINVKHHFYTRETHGWSEQEEMNFWHQYYPNIIREVKPLTLAVPTINQMKQDGHEIIIITARWPEPSCDVPGLTLEWLKQHNIQYDEIVMNADDKAKVALEKKIDIFIDDSFQNCEAVAKIGIKTYLMNSRTNKGWNADDITRVYSWPDFYDKIKFC